MTPVMQADLPLTSLLEVLFETKPLDSNKEYRLNVVASPVKAIYDAETINDMAKFFKPPESLQLKQLQVAAAAKFQELRESSTAGQFGDPTVCNVYMILCEISIGPSSFCPSASPYDCLSVAVSVCPICLKIFLPVYLFG